MTKGATSTELLCTRRPSQGDTIMALRLLALLVVCGLSAALAVDSVPQNSYESSLLELLKGAQQEAATEAKLDQGTSLIDSGASQDLQSSITSYVPFRLSAASLFRSRCMSSKVLLSSPALNPLLSTVFAHHNIGTIV